MATFWQEFTIEPTWDFWTPTTNYFKPQISNLGEYSILRGALTTPNFSVGTVATITGVGKQFASKWGLSEFVYPAVYEEILSLTYSRTWLVPLSVQAFDGGVVLSIKQISSSDPLYNIIGSIGTLRLDGIMYLRGGTRGGEIPYLYREEELALERNFNPPFDIEDVPPRVITEWFNNRINLRMFIGHVENSNFRDLGYNAQWTDAGKYDILPTFTGNYTYPGIVLGKDLSSSRWTPTLVEVDERRGHLRLPSYQYPATSSILHLYLDGIRFIPDNKRLVTTAYGNPTDVLSLAWNENYDYGARPISPFTNSAIASANIAVQIQDRVSFAPVDYVIGRLGDSNGELSPDRPMKFPAIIYDPSISIPNNPWKVTHITVKNGQNDFSIPQTVITFSRFEHLGLNDFYLWACPFWDMAQEPFT